MLLTGGLVGHGLRFPRCQQRRASRHLVHRRRTRDFPLLINQGKGDFDDLTQASGLRATKDMSGWGNGIFDFDNDGWKDLFVARANVLDNISELGRAANIRSRIPCFAIWATVSLQDVGPSAGPDFVEEAAHRGVAFGDFSTMAALTRWSRFSVGTSKFCATSPKPAITGFFLSSSGRRAIAWASARRFTSRHRGWRLPMERGNDRGRIHRFERQPSSLRSG